MRHMARKTIKNTVLLTLFEIANPFISLLLIGTMSRNLGAGALGAYNLLLTFFFVAHSFTSLGLNSLITREVSRDPGRAGRFLGTSAILGGACSLLVGLGIVGAIRLAGYDADVQQSGWLVAACLLPSIVILSVESILIAYEKIEFIVYLALIENVGRTLVGLWLIHRGYGVTALMASFTLFRVLTLALNLLVFRRQIGPLEWTIDPAILRDLLKGIPVFGGILVASTLYWKADVFLLSKMVTLEAVGYYTAAYRLFAITQVLPKSFNTSIYPVFSRLFLQSQESYRKANSLAIRYILVVLLPVSAGISGLAEPIVRLLFGRDFGSAVPVLKVVIWTLVPYGVVRVFASAMFASNRQHLDLKVNLLGLAANLGLNCVLIPRMGILGCAWATLLSICLFLLIQCVYLRREILPQLRQAEIARPAAATLAILAWLAATPSLHLALRVAGGAALYGGILAWLQVIRLNELKLVLPERVLALFTREVEL